MRISDWSSDVCSSDLRVECRQAGARSEDRRSGRQECEGNREPRREIPKLGRKRDQSRERDGKMGRSVGSGPGRCASREQPHSAGKPRSEEHTSELQSLMRNSYAVFCLKKKKKSNQKGASDSKNVTKTYKL